MTIADRASLPPAGTQIRVDGELVTVVAAIPTADGADFVLRRSDGTLTDAALTHAAGRNLQEQRPACRWTCSRP